MKKTLAVALALTVVMVFALGACSKGGGDKADTPEMQATTEKADTVGYITDDVDHLREIPTILYMRIT